MSLPNPFNTLQKFSANGAEHSFYSLPALEKAGFKVSRLPVSIRLVLESLLRNCDGKRVAEGAVRDLAGWQAKAPRTEEIPFVRASYEAQQAGYAQISGNLKMNGRGAAAAPMAAANAEVQLLDKAGRVVQSTRSTAAGVWRFKNIDAGAYTVRIRKDGYAPVEREIKAAKAEEAGADVDLH